MKRFLLVLVLLAVCAQPGFCIDEWDSSDPAGTESPSDLDTIIQTNNGVLDRMLADYKSGCKLEYVSTATFYVKAGGVVCSNEAGTTNRIRRNTANTTVTWADIDIGSEAVSTTYYVYAVADADATTFTVKISTSATKPNGVTYYRRLGTFYNNSSGNIEQINEDVTKVAIASGTVAHGGTIPLPAGFAEAECHWMVSLGNGDSSPPRGQSHPDGLTFHVSASGTRTVTAQWLCINNPASSGNLVSANYIIIGVRAGN